MGDVGLQLTEPVPVETSGEGEQAGLAADFLVGEADLDGLFWSWKFDELGHGLATGIAGVIRCFGMHPSTTSKP